LEDREPLETDGPTDEIHTGLFVTNVERDDTTRELPQLADQLIELAPRSLRHSTTCHRAPAAHTRSIVRQRVGALAQLRRPRLRHVERLRHPRLRRLRLRIRGRVRMTDCREGRRVPFVLLRAVSAALKPVAVVLRLNYRDPV
jgi:hypothetical protein